MRFPTAVVIFLLGVTSGFAQSAQRVQSALSVEAKALQTWASDKIFIEAVRSQNAQKTKLAVIQRLDREWVSGKQESLVKSITSGPCADRLRQLIAKNSAYSESFLMDAQGALVCANQKTSDYWQGDEAKWIRGFSNGKGVVFIDRPKHDESAKSRIAQISVPVMDGKDAIGVITVGVLLEKLAMPRP